MRLLSIILVSICGVLWGLYLGSTKAVVSTDMFVRANDLRGVNIIMFGVAGFLSALIIGVLIVKFAPKACLAVSIFAGILALVPVGLFIVSNNGEAKKDAEVSAQDHARDVKLQQDGLAALNEIGQTLGLRTVLRNDGWQGRTYSFNGSTEQIHDQLLTLGAVQTIKSDPGSYSMALKRNGHSLNVLISTSKDGQITVDFTFFN